MNKLVVIGDSIVNGGYIPDPEKAWPSQLAGVRSPKIVNAGVPADKATNPTFTARFNAAVLKPEVSEVIISIGLNDCTDGVNEGATYSIIRDCFWRAYNDGKIVHVTTIPPILPSFPAYAVCNPIRNALNGILRAVFFAEPVLFDFDALLRGADGNLKPEYAFDDIHPSELGLLKMAEMVRKALR